jgi:hypothetical protein
MPGFEKPGQAARRSGRLPPTTAIRTPGAVQESPGRKPRGKQPAWTLALKTRSRDAARTAPSGRICGCRPKPRASPWAVLQRPCRAPWVRLQRLPWVRSRRLGIPDSAGAQWDRSLPAAISFWFPTHAVDAIHGGPEGAVQESPGRRPWEQAHARRSALQGRCRQIPDCIHLSPTARRSGSVRFRPAALPGPSPGPGSGDLLQSTPRCGIIRAF